MYFFAVILILATRGSSSLINAYLLKYILANHMTSPPCITCNLISKTLIFLSSRIFVGHEEPGSTCVTGAWLVARWPGRQVSTESGCLAAIGHIPQCTALKQTAPSPCGWAGVQSTEGGRLVSTERERWEGVGLLVAERQTVMKRFGMRSGEPWQRHRNTE